MLSFTGIDATYSFGMSPLYVIIFVIVFIIYMLYRFNCITYTLYINCFESEGRAPTLSTEHWWH